MTVTLAHPFRIDSNGAAVTLEQGLDPARRGNLRPHRQSCEAGERPLAPLWGLMDPTGTRVNADEITATIGYAEPALLVARVEVTEIERQHRGRRHRRRLGRHRRRGRLADGAA
jgi:hypothetical protein